MSAGLANTYTDSQNWVPYTTPNVEDGARVDIVANGLWGGRYERTFIDVRIFNPHAPSIRNFDLATCYRKHGRSKKRAYEERVREVGVNVDR